LTLGVCSLSATSRDPRDDDERVEEALSSVTPLERLVWGKNIRNAALNPASRLFKSVPRIGVRSATHHAVAGFWGRPIILAFFAILLLESGNPDTAEEVGGWFIVAIVTCCMLLSFFRIFTAFRAGHLYQRRLSQ
jgi:hypothetical protein